MYTGPGRAAVAWRTASRTISGMRVGSSTRVAYFVSGTAASSSGPYWNRPRRTAWSERRTRWVPIATTGQPSIHAHASPGSRLATPGPPAAPTAARPPDTRA